MTACSCSPGACHGGHTITRLSATQTWMLAHGWTEMSEGDSGWMWQHTTGRKVAVFRDLTDPHAWEGLIGRLAVAHARHPGDIEREIRGGDEPVRLADEQLRRITEYVHPDEATAYVRPWLHSMAGELLAARTRITELDAKVEHWTERTALAGQGLGRHIAEQEAQLADQAATLDRIRTALAGHPRCEEHPEGDVIKCGWKRAVGSVQAALDAAPADQQPSGYVVGWEETEGRVTIALDESEPHPDGGPDRFAYTDLGDARMFLAEISPEDPDTTFHVYELNEVAE